MGDKRILCPCPRCGHGTEHHHLECVAAAEAALDWSRKSMAETVELLNAAEARAEAAEQRAMEAGNICSQHNRNVRAAVYEAGFRAGVEAAAVQPAHVERRPLRSIVFASEPNERGEFWVDLDCGHRLASRAKHVSYFCNECPPAQPGNGASLRVAALEWFHAEVLRISTGDEGSWADIAELYSDERYKPLNEPAQPGTKEET